VRSARRVHVVCMQCTRTGGRAHCSSNARVVSIDACMCNGYAKHESTNCLRVCASVLRIAQLKTKSFSTEILDLMFHIGSDFSDDLSSWEVRVANSDLIVEVMTSPAARTRAAHAGSVITTTGGWAHLRTARTFSFSFSPLVAYGFPCPIATTASFASTCAPKGDGHTAVVDAQ